MYIYDNISMFLTKNVEKMETHVLCSVTSFPEKLAVYEIMWKSMVETDRTQTTI
jgi:hypothetical protein